MVRAWLREASGASAGADPIAARRDEIDRVLAEVERVLDPPAWSALARPLAEHHLLHDRSTEARALLWRALAIEEARLGPDHPDLAVVLSTLAAAVAPPECRKAMWLDLDDPEALFVVDGLDITAAVFFACHLPEGGTRVGGVPLRTENGHQ